MCATLHVNVLVALFICTFSNAIHACVYFNQGHPTKVSTKLMSKIYGRLSIVFQQVLPVIKLYIHYNSIRFVVILDTCNLLENYC